MRKNLKKVLIIVVILGIIIAVIAAFFILNSTPDELSEAEKEEAVAQILGRKPNLNPDIKTGNVEFVGEKLTFSYPARAEIYDYEDPEKANNTTTIEILSFDIENPRLILNYTAVNKPELKSLIDEPAVSLREDDSRGYLSEEIEVDGVSALSYSKEASGGNRAERSAFILKDGVLYTISITGASSEDVEKLFDQIISSASFR